MREQKEIKKIVAIITIIALSMYLVGCGRTVLTVTTEATTKEITEADYKQDLSTDELTTEVIEEEAGETDAEKIITEEASTEELKENVVITENAERGDFFVKYYEGTDERRLFGIYKSKSFEIIIADKGSDKVDVYLDGNIPSNENTPDNLIVFYLSGDVADTSLKHSDLTLGTVEVSSGEVEFTITYKDGKTVNITVHVPES